DNFVSIPSGVDTQKEREDSNYWQKYKYVNGTEHNLRLDTEDLNGSNDLDTQNNYFEYSIPLNDLATADSVLKPEEGVLGWKFLRVPIGAFISSSNFGGGSADWHSIKHVRIWISGVPAGNRVSIGQLDVVGNR